MVESHSKVGLGLDDNDRHLLNLLVGYAARSAGVKSALLFVLPLVVSISFLLIADIDSPRGGFIHVVPQNLVSLSKSLPRQ